ncbi:peptidyl-prolyl cis-trans isomerase G-like isoform X2 [Anneissia japonica]|uniref:peptidyl-prolyl cis-trans isomerase G-like isoform X2 n=1 Tax=Anneissia japonica TaxID=1529436 RepID=UPI00142581C4|nr:peptidyl-prolyl cis-trans isomerase G-like isoform X2 [Anneissia japonica]
MVTKMDSNIQEALRNFALQKMQAIEKERHRNPNKSNSGDETATKNTGSIGTVKENHSESTDNIREWDKKEGLQYRDDVDTNERKTMFSAIIQSRIAKEMKEVNRIKQIDHNHLKKTESIYVDTEKHVDTADDNGKGKIQEKKPIQIKIFSKDLSEPNTKKTNTLDEDDNEDVSTSSSSEEEKSEVQRLLPWRELPEDGELTASSYSDVDMQIGSGIADKKSDKLEEEDIKRDSKKKKKHKHKHKKSKHKKSKNKSKEKTKEREDKCANEKRSVRNEDNDVFDKQRLLDGKYKKKDADDNMKQKEFDERSCSTSKEINIENEVIDLNEFLETQLENLNTKAQADENKNKRTSDEDIIKNCSLNEGEIKEMGKTDKKSVGKILPELLNKDLKIESQEKVSQGITEKKDASIENTLKDKPVSDVNKSTVQKTDIDKSVKNTIEETKKTSINITKDKKQQKEIEDGGRDKDLSYSKAKKRKRDKNEASDGELTDKSKKRCRDEERKRKDSRRSRSRSRTRSRRHRKSSSRSPSRRSHTTDRYRHRSRSKSRERRSRSRGRRSKSRDRRSKSRDRRSKSRERRSKSRERRSRSRDRRSRSRGRRSRSRGRRSQSRERKSKTKTSRMYSDHKPERSVADRIDKAKLLEIAKANAYAQMKAGLLPASLKLPPLTVEDKASQRAGGQTITELTAVCQAIQKKGEGLDSGDESPVNKPIDSDEDSETFINHPFKLRPQPQSIVVNIKNAVQRPNMDKDKLRIQFPVSSGSQHRKKEEEVSPYGAWVPYQKPTAQTAAAPSTTTTTSDTSTVATPAASTNTTTNVTTTTSSTKMPTMAAGGQISFPANPELCTPVLGQATNALMTPVVQTVTPTPATLPAPVPSVHPNDRVFEETPSAPAVDIATMVSARLKAARALESNPLDVEALGQLHKAQRGIQSWANVSNKPGQFTGSTGVQILNPKELANSNPRAQAWAKKEFHHSKHDLPRRCCTPHGA